MGAGHWGPHTQLVSTALGSYAHLEAEDGVEGKYGMRKGVMAGSGLSWAEGELKWVRHRVVAPSHWRKCLDYSGLEAVGENPLSIPAQPTVPREVSLPLSLGYRLWWALEVWLVDSASGLGLLCPVLALLVEGPGQGPFSREKLPLLISRAAYRCPQQVKIQDMFFW